MTERRTTKEQRDLLVSTISQPNVVLDVVADLNDAEAEFTQYRTDANRLAESLEVDHEHCPEDVDCEPRMALVSHRALGRRGRGA